MSPLICPCGCGLTSDLWAEDVQHTVADQVRRLGPTVVISTGKGAWRVPRVFVAFHGIAANQVARLAGEHGWEAVP